MEQVTVRNPPFAASPEFPVAQGLQPSDQSPTRTIYVTEWQSKKNRKQEENPHTALVNTAIHSGVAGAFGAILGAVSATLAFNIRRTLLHPDPFVYHVDSARSTLSFSYQDYMRRCISTPLNREYVYLNSNFHPVLKGTNLPLFRVFSEIRSAPSFEGVLGELEEKKITRKQVYAAMDLAERLMSPPHVGESLKRQADKVLPIQTEDDPVKWAESLVLGYVKHPEEKLPLLRQVLSSEDLVEDGKFHVLAALADYEVECQDPELLEILQGLAWSSEADLAFSATHVLAVGNKEIAGQIADQLRGKVEDDLLTKLRKKALETEGIEVEL